MDRFITKMTKIIIALFMALMVGLVFSQVVFRYFLGSTPFFIEEVSRGLLIWVCFLGASIALKASQHIGVDFFVSKLPGKIQKQVKLLAGILVGVFLLFFLIASAIYSVNQLGQQSATLPITMFWFYLALPFGTFLMILQLVFCYFEGEN